MARSIAGNLPGALTAALVTVSWLCLCLASACTEPRDASTSAPASACVGCHGDRSGPEPVDALHAAHLTAGGAFSAVACADCHVVPVTPLDPGHLDATPGAEVVFSGAAVSSAAPTPSYDPQTGTCSGLTCHGGALAEPAPAAFVWDPTDVAPGDCGTCHALPPGGAHPSVADPRALDCASCHGARVPRTHADQRVQLVLPSDCGSCHGDALDPAPADAGHDAHLFGNTLGASVECDSCHVVPQDVVAVGHLDSGPPAELAFHGLAVAEGAAPVWDGTGCSDAYCHGAAAPVWGDESGAYRECDACHGAPPDADGHPMSQRCEVCHTPVAGPNRLITAPERHVDGRVDFVEPSCDSCHAHGADIAPGSGAHPAHTRVGVACQTCHAVPDTVAASGHLDSGPPAEVTLAGLATARGAAPHFDASDASCDNAYCHRPSASAGGFEHAPGWYDVDSAAGECGACHSVPPSTHPAGLQSDCTACHVAFPEEHVNGTIDL